MCHSFPLAAVDARPDRPGLALAGVPVAVKDNIAVTGEPMRVGSRASPAGPQACDHPVVARLRAAGAVVVGVTRMPELALWPFTDGAFGMARNPWDVSRTCGGSSGGSAAAVAAALVPLAHGNDALGSIRGPAAACGLVGVKPGFGLVPAGPGADVWCSMGENGPIATTVADAALGLSVMADDPALARAVQLSSKAGSEPLLLALAGQIQALRPWARHAPSPAASGHPAQP
jgi:amidase